MKRSYVILERGDGSGELVHFHDGESVQYADRTEAEEDATGGDIILEVNQSEINEGVYYLLYHSPTRRFRENEGETVKFPTHCDARRAAIAGETVIKFIQK